MRTPKSLPISLLALRSLAIIAFASLSTNAAGQTCNPNTQFVNVTYNESQARVTVPSWCLGHVTATVGPNFVYCRFLSANDNIFPMKDALFGRVWGKTRSELVAFLNEVDSSGSKNQKMDKLFARGLDSATVTSGADISASQMQLLKMGQEVTVQIGAGTNLQCFSPQQIDQAIAEGRRVLVAIIAAMAPPQ